MNTNALFRNNVKLVIAKRFVFEARANIYAAYLRESGIKCFISNSATGTLIPFVEGGFLLHVSENDLEDALELIREMDENAALPVEEDYHDADISDIEYAREVNEYEQKVRRGNGKYAVWFFLAALIFLSAYLALSHKTPKTGLLYNNHPASLN